MTQLDPGSWHAAVDRANHDLYREVARRSGGRAEEHDGLTLVIGVHPSPIIANMAFRTRRSLAAEGIPDLVRESYERIGHGASLMTAEHADADLEAVLEGQAWRRMLRFPTMVREARIAAEQPAGARLRWVDPVRDLSAYRQLMEIGFGEDSPEEREMIGTVFARPDSVSEGAAAAILSVDGADAAGGMVYLVGDAAAVGWIATMPEFRRRGLGAFVTAAVTNRGFDMGARFATLQAASRGFQIYARLGYDVVTTHSIWFPPRT